MIHHDLPCATARERLSARLDGELEHESSAAFGLDEHLAECAACRVHERALAGLAQAFEALREPLPHTDLWPRIERRAFPRRVPVLARVAAALVGFVGLGGAGLLFERSDADPASTPRHVFERLAPTLTPDALFASVPEYRVLRAFPSRTPSQETSR